MPSFCNEKVRRKADTPLAFDNCASILNILDFSKEHAFL